MIEFFSLYVVAFMSATILPGVSEAYMLGLYYTGNFKPGTLVLVGTFGNVCGSTTNWLLGRYLLHFQDRKWFPASKKQMQKATNYYHKWGVWSLLFAWLPIIGDALTLVAGIFKANIWLFLLLVTIGKSLRYIFVMLAAMTFV